MHVTNRTEEIKYKNEIHTNKKKLLTAVHLSPVPDFMMVVFTFNEQGQK